MLEPNNTSNDCLLNRNYSVRFLLSVLALSFESRSLTTLKRRTSCSMHQDGGFIERALYHLNDVNQSSVGYAYLLLVPAGPSFQYLRTRQGTTLGQNASENASPSQHEQEQWRAAEPACAQAKLRHFLVHSSAQAQRWAALPTALPWRGRTWHRFAEFSTESVTSSHKSARQMPCNRCKKTAGSLLTRRASSRLTRIFRNLHSHGRRQVSA